MLFSGIEIRKIDGPLQAGVVVEVEVWLCYLPPVPERDRAAAWDVRLIELVVHLHRDLVHRSVACLAGDVGKEGQETALMLPGLRSVYENLGPVRCRAEAQEASVSLHRLRYERIRFIPYVSCEFPYVLICIEILEARGDRYYLMSPDPAFPAFAASFPIPVDAELPHPIESYCRSRLRILRIEHRVFKHSCLLGLLIISCRWQELIPASCARIPTTGLQAPRALFPLRSRCQ